MATNIFNYDGTLLTTVADGSLDQSHASIKFPGKGYQNYGGDVLEDILWVMQNFSGTNEPSYPSVGQLWYDTSLGLNILKIWTGSSWTTAGGVIASATSPGPGSNQGAFWYDTTNKQLNIWNANNWDIVGPLGSKINADPTDPAVPGNSVIEAMTVVGVEDSALHQLWRISIGGKILAILSKDKAFTPQSSTLTANGFAKIYPGINFNSTIASVGLTGDSTIFKSTQSNLPNLDSTYDLGSITKRFGTLYSANGVFSNGIGINTSSFAYNFEVNGTSKFDGPVTLAAGTASTAPIALTSGSLVTNPQIGAVEFDGNNFYFTGLLNGIPTRRTPIFGTAGASSNNLYVSTFGNDTNDGRSKTSAFRTISYALNYLITNNLSGYTIFIESGEYLEQNPMYVPPKTSIVGDNLRRVIIRPVHNHLDIFHVDVNTYFFGMTFKDHRAPAFCFAFACSLANATVGLDPLSPTYGQLTQIKTAYSQTGYSVSPSVFVEPPPYGAGNTQATAIANLVNGAFVDVVVTNGGSGYSTAPGAVTATIVGGGGNGATFSVRVLNGVVVAVDILTPGQNYASPISITLSGGGGTGATANVVLGDGVISSYTITNPGSGYTRVPWVSVRGITPPFITSSPYVQNCSSITGPFDTSGNLITLLPPYPADGVTPAGTGFGPVDLNGAGSGLRIDGEVVDPASEIRSFVADAFTQLNQGGVGHLIINQGYTQFVSCFTTFSSIGYWARSGGFANISNSVIDFGNIGLQAEGYYPVPYTAGTVHQNYSSTVGLVNVFAGGTGYVANSTFTVVFNGGLLAGGVAATGEAITNAAGSVVQVRVLTPGSGYSSVPTLDFTAGGGTGASAAAVLEPPATIQVDGVAQKPRFGSGVTVGGAFYTITNVSSVGTGSWNINTTPPIYSANAASAVAFYSISNISTGGLALEYVGSGVTYNALPTYGGIPNIDNEVVDGTDPLSPYYPGRVYYVTIDNTGNFRIGPYFSVNFVDGTVKLNANAFQLTNLTQIGPFTRNGVPVGTYANEISYDPTLTHLISPDLYDDHTIPSQSAVRGYFQQIIGNVLPATSNVSSIGSSTFRWQNVIAGNVIADTAKLQNLNTGNITATGTINTNNLNVTGLANIATETVASSTISSATIGTAGITTATIGTANITTLNTSGLALNTGSINTLTAGTGTFSSDVTINGKLTVNGTTTTINSTTTTLVDPVIDIGTALNNVPLISNDGLDRGLHFHYFNTATPGGETAGDNHAFLGFQSSSHDLLYLLNVSPGTETIPNPHSLTGTKWGNIQVGNGTFNGTVTATGAMTGASLGLTGAITASSIAVTGAITGASSTISGALAAGSITSTNISASSISSSGALSGGTLSISGASTVAGLTAGAISASSLTASGTISTTGAMTATGTVTGGALTTSGTLTAGTTNLTGVLTVTGSIVTTGDITAFSTSDQRLKSNVKIIPDALSKVLAIDGVSFDWTQEALTLQPYKPNNDVGVIAQQVEAVFPEVVTTRADGYKAVQYEKLIPLMLEAIKELSLKVAKLEQDR